MERNLQFLILFGKRLKDEESEKEIEEKLSQFFFKSESKRLD